MVLKLLVASVIEAQLLFFVSSFRGLYILRGEDRFVIGLSVRPNTGLGSPGERSEIRGRERKVGFKFIRKDLEIAITWGI